MTFRIYSRNFCFKILPSLELRNLFFFSLFFALLLHLFAVLDCVLYGAGHEGRGSCSCCSLQSREETRHPSNFLLLVSRPLVGILLSPVNLHLMHRSLRCSFLLL